MLTISRLHNLFRHQNDKSSNSNSKKKKCERMSERARTPALCAHRAKTTRIENILFARHQIIFARIERRPMR